MYRNRRSIRIASTDGEFPEAFECIVFPMPEQGHGACFTAIEIAVDILGCHRCHGNRIPHLFDERTQERRLSLEPHAHGLLQSHILQSCQFKIHSKPPRSSSATSRNRGMSTFAYTRVESAELCPRCPPTSVNVRP